MNQKKKVVMSKAEFGESIDEDSNTKIKKYHISMADEDFVKIPQTHSTKRRSKILNSAQLNKFKSQFETNENEPRLRDIERLKKTIPKRIQDRINNQRDEYRLKFGKFRMTNENKKKFFGLEKEEIEDWKPKKLIIVQHQYDGNRIQTFDDVD